MLPNGVRSADGVVHEVDVIIYGTGFAATEFLAPMQITGVDGADLHGRWKEGARAYLGLSVPDFPNLFVVYGPNTNLGGSSIINMLEAASGAITTLLRHAESQGGGAVVVRPDAEQRFDDEIQERLANSVWANCSQLVPRGRRPDHHQLARPGRGVPAPLRRARRERLRDRLRHLSRRARAAACARSGSARRSTSRVVGATSPRPSSRNLQKLRSGLPSVHSR